MVIAKRLEVYEQLYSSLGRLQTVLQSPMGEKYHGIFLTRDSYDDFINFLAASAHREALISNDLSKKNSELVSYLNWNFELLFRAGKIQRDVLRIANEKHSEINKHKEAIQDQIMADLLNMNDVTGFIQSKR